MFQLFVLWIYHDRFGHIWCRARTITEASLKAVKMFGPMLWPQGPVGPPLSTVQQEHRKFGTGRPDPSTQGISRGKWCSSTWLTGRNVNVVTWIC